MLMKLPNLASTGVSLRGIFWLYASKVRSGASLADQHDLAVLFVRLYGNDNKNELRESIIQGKIKRTGIPLLT